MLTLGVTIFIGVDSTWRSLQVYQNEAYKRDNQADIELIIKPTVLDRKKIAGIKHVKNFETSLKTEQKNLVVNAVQPNFKLNGFTITGGKAKLKGNNCVLDQSFAEQNKIKVGDQMTIAKQQYKVAGLATSSSYLYLTPDSTTVIPNHKEYGFVYITNERPVVNRILLQTNQVKQVKKELQSVFKQDIISLSSTKETLNDLAVSQKITQYQTIGSLFPVVFFMIVILMSFTTMYRLINRERQTIGTMRSLGLSDSQILLHYLSYSFLVSIVGTVLGVVLGWKLIPPYIWRFFNELFVFGDYKIILDFKQVLLVSILGILCTCLATVFVFKRLSREKPAELLRDKVDEGHQSRILISSKMQVLNKLIFRQISNGKLRAIMTVIGVAGSTGLLLSALGIRDTVNGVANTVYERNYLYDAKIYLNQSVQTNKKNTEFLMEYPVFLMSASHDKTSIVHILEDQSKLIRIYQPSGEAVNLKTDEILITEKTAKLYDVKVGDRMRFYDSKGNLINFKVTTIGQLNIGQGVYLTQESWKNLAQNFVPTSIISKNQNLADLESHATKVTKTEQQKKDFLKSMSSTLSMSLLLILAAGSLLIIVLYNLGVLNFSDRSRSLATLSVLGFKNQELKKILSTENIFLSIAGIIIGIPVGKMLHHKIFANAGMGDELDFTPLIALKSYFITIGFTIALIVLVTFLLNRKIRKIKMVEALKSVE
ncbi:hypothetical protein XA3_04900 [Xylocopilactobacillus apicola]|uniref:Efflux ABC transporter, permease protein n=2 Tax=Xylocopilactobacillus apicola TaxID=2932184 RepID=A0AAU9CVP2_9LACO|nr:hypothetical protein XA3_04900 [Xylocopilactobacillus apicola]